MSEKISTQEEEFGEITGYSYPPEGEGDKYIEIIYEDSEGEVELRLTREDVVSFVKDMVEWLAGEL